MRHARRVTEAEAARLQELASRAVRRLDWNEVERLLAELRSLAVHSPWLGEIVAGLEELASQRDDRLFGKEARYAASSLSDKLRSKWEFDPDFSDSSAPLSLRRKTRQGRSGHYVDKGSSKKEDEESR